MSKATSHSAANCPTRSWRLLLNGAKQSSMESRDDIEFNPLHQWLWLEILSIQAMNLISDKRGRAQPGTGQTYSWQCKPDCSPVPWHRPSQGSARRANRVSDNRGWRGWGVRWIVIAWAHPLDLVLKDGNQHPSFSLHRPWPQCPCKVAVSQYRHTTSRATRYPGQILFTTDFF